VPSLLRLQSVVKEVSPPKCVCKHRLSFGLSSCLTGSGLPIGIEIIAQVTESWTAGNWSIDYAII
jgi:hypothetical protein